MTPPRRNTSRRHSVQASLKQKVLSAFEQLPANQQKVASALLQQPDDLPFLTTEQLSKRLGVSKATIVRLAQRLGYKGFAELQGEMSGALQSDLASVYQFAGALDPQQTADTPRAVAEAELENINQTLKVLDRKVFQDVVRALMKAKQVYTMGIGISSLLAQILAYELNQVAVNARALSSAHARFIELLAFVGRDDVVVGFSFPPYSKETVNAAAFARKHGAIVVAVTDSETSPIAFEASRVIIVRTKNILYTNSIAAFSMVINAIATEIAMRTKSTVAAMVQDVNDSMEESGEYLRARLDQRNARRASQSPFNRKGD